MNKLIKISKKYFGLSIREKILLERKSRLSNNTEILPINSNPFTNKIRNIGTIAHIDAGKTTLTERLLYFCGGLPHMGEVHDGSAFMDYLEDEQQRGITITSACVTFQWQDNQINLIDTPGHADFNFEVERSLKVLEGALIILDGTKGIEAQTETVWRQSNKYKISKICVINKLDLTGGDYFQCIEQIKQRFEIQVFPLYFPLYKNQEFIGVYNIFQRTIEFWNEDLIKKKQCQIEKIDWQKINKNDKNQFLEILEYIIEVLSENDPSIMEEYIESSIDQLPDIYFNKLQKLVKKLIFEMPNKYCYAIPASALKNKGIIQVLNSVNQYLPSPKQFIPNKDDQFAFIFKTIKDNQYGNLNFIRILNGSIKLNDTLINSRNKQEIKITKIYRNRANEYINIKEAQTGDIVVLGDIQVQSGDYIYQSTTNTIGLLMKGFDKIESLFYQSLRFENPKEKAQFLKIINEIIKDDPSLQYEQNQETGEIILKGLGELHLEVVLKRIQKNHKLNIQPGKISIAFKEILQCGSEYILTIDKSFGNKQKYLEVELETQALDFQDSQNTKDIEIIFDLWKKKSIQKEFINFCKIKDENPKYIYESYQTEESQGEIKLTDNNYYDYYKLRTLSFKKLYEIRKTLLSMSRNGLLTYNPLKNCRIIITDGKWIKKLTDDTSIKILGTEFQQECLNQNNLCLLEPFVRVQLNVPQEYISTVISDCNQRGGKLEQSKSDGKNGYLIINLPLMSTNNYTGYLRSITKGQVDLVMQSSGYYRVPHERFKQIKNLIQLIINKQQ